MTKPSSRRNGEKGGTGRRYIESSVTGGTESTSIRQMDLTERLCRPVPDVDRPTKSGRVQLTNGIVVTIWVAASKLNMTWRCESSSCSAGGVLSADATIFRMHRASEAEATGGRKWDSESARLRTPSADRVPHASIVAVVSLCSLTTEPALGARPSAHI